MQKYCKKYLTIIRVFCRELKMRVPWLANSFKKKISLLGFFPLLSLVFKIKMISYMHIVVLFYASFQTYTVTIKVRLHTS